MTFFLGGCAVEEFVGQREGFIYATAVDTLGGALEGASIFIDGQRRTERTPALLHCVQVGRREVVTRLLGYWNDTTIVDVVNGETRRVAAELRQVPADQTGRLKVDSTPAGARVLLYGSAVRVDGALIVTPAQLDLPWGRYELSVRRDGYATTAPLLPLIEITAGETVPVLFTLEAVETEKRVGMLPPDFTLENVDRDSIRLSDLTGCVVLLNFWYADCIPCMREFPGIENVYRELGGEGFRVAAVNPMFPDDLDDVLLARQNAGLTFELLLDWDRQVTVGLYRIGAFPANILIDRTGRISAILASVHEAELRGMVGSLLNVGNGETD